MASIRYRATRNGARWQVRYRDTDGTCKCAIEKAYREGRTDFYKPISCHLYPIRLTQSGEYTMVNYHRWEVCKCACKLGKKLDIPVYKFLKEPLIRRIGAEWNKELETVVKELKKQKDLPAYRRKSFMIRYFKHGRYVMILQEVLK